MRKVLDKLQQFLTTALSNNLFMFLLLMTIGVLLSAYYKWDNFWDFTNYHYYNAFAFLNDRLNYDIVPASVNTFFNPIIELPLYFAIQKFNDNLDLIYALQGIWAGLLIFTFYKICTLFFDITKIKNMVYVIVILLIGMTGQAAWYQVGSPTNEFPVGFLILWGLYILLKMIKQPSQQKFWKFFAAGLIMGISLGLKQTVIGYCLSAGLMLIFCYPYFSKPIKTIFLFALGGLLGYLIVNGWFMYQYWVLYDNPFFPFLNGIFKSEYFDSFNYRDTRFLPKWYEALIYPYIWLFKPLSISESVYRDIRIPLYYTVLWVSLAVVFIRHQIKKFYFENHLMTAFFIFMFLSFFIWMFLFSILRYVMVFEVLGALLLGIVLTAKMPRTIIMQILYITFLIVLSWVSITMVKHSANWDTAKNHQKVMDLENVNFPPNTLLKLYNFPTAAVIPEWSKNNDFRAVGHLQKNCIYMKGSDFIERGKFREIRDEIEKNHQGPVVILYYDASWKQEEKLENHEIGREKCRRFRELGALPSNFDCEEPRCKPWIETEKVLQEEIRDKYFCRELKFNRWRYLHICVPKELKTYILGE